MMLLSICLAQVLIYIFGKKTAAQYCAGVSCTRVKLKDGYVMS